VDKRIAQQKINILIKLSINRNEWKL